MSIEVSFLVPSYNAEAKLSRCLNSLTDLRKFYQAFEVIFVDDCSSDRTAQLLRSFVADKEWANLKVLERNTGSPSTPRNVALSEATGSFVYYLDIDDEIIIDGFLTDLKVARETNADVVRAPLYRKKSSREILLNQIPNWDSKASNKQKIEDIIRHQSTTVGGLIRREIITENGIKWRDDLRMGEDTIFWIEVLSLAKRIEYSDAPDYRYNNERVDGVVSSTQTYGDRELSNHLFVWEYADATLTKIGSSFLQSRGQVALQTSLLNLIHLNRGGISPEVFERFSRFVRKNWSVLSGFKFDSRLRELLESVRKNNFTGFTELIKERLLIAGYDLKFIKGAYPGLKRKYSVKIDQWKGHNSHDENRSLELLKWADVIHCEWLLGNAVWYSEKKLPRQKLTVRIHLFELTREYGYKIRMENVDRFIAVSLPTLEDAVGTFGIPREKIRLLPNFINVASYEQNEDPDKLFRLALVGCLPARKGLHRAIKLLADLKAIDSRYSLTIFGKKPVDLAWVKNDPQEVAYYERCQRVAVELGVASSVTWAGWTDLTKELCNFGFVLSVSDFESFHVAPAEAFAAGNVALFLPWRGVEFIFPRQYVMKDLESMRDAIAGTTDLQALEKLAEPGYKWVVSTMDTDKFVAAYDDLLVNI